MEESTSYSSLNNDNDPSRIQRLSILETAMEIMATMLGNASIRRIQAKEEGRTDEIIRIDEETQELLAVRDAIYLGEGDAIDRAIKEFGPVIKARFLAA